MSKVISLFSGCGGLDLGFLGGFDFLGKHYPSHGFEIIWANEINEKACLTYKENIGDHIVIGDIWDYINKVPIKADVVIGGFPCQDISINGKMAGAIYGSRSSLYRAMVEVISRVRPKIFVAENVKGLLLKSNRESLSRVLSDFSGLGYNVTYKLYNSAEYGVPQSRERVFIVGTDQDVFFSPPEPVLTAGNFITSHQALSDLERIPENAEFSHIWSRANVSSDQGNRRLIANRVGYTIRAECHGNIQFHYNQDRRISMREAARIQSFPDNFVFRSKLRETERQIGNAVPPVLAWHIANSVMLALTRK